MESIRILFVFGIAVLAAGCGGSDADLAQVEGTVTLDGVPLEGANVGFQPQQGSESYGVTDATGHYVLYFAGDTKGAELGQNTVRITTPSPSDDDSRKRPQIPARYNTETELTRMVEKGSNTIDFSLESD